MEKTTGRHSIEGSGPTDILSRINKVMKRRWWDQKTPIVRGEATVECAYHNTRNSDGGVCTVTYSRVVYGGKEEEKKQKGISRKLYICLRLDIMHESDVQKWAREHDKGPRWKYSKENGRRHEQWMCSRTIKQIKKKSSLNLFCFVLGLELIYVSMAETKKKQSKNKQTYMILYIIFTCMYIYIYIYFVLKRKKRCHHFRGDHIILWRTASSKNPVEVPTLAGAARGRAGNMTRRTRSMFLFKKGVSQVVSRRIALQAGSTVWQKKKLHLHKPQTFPPPNREKAQEEKRAFQ